MKSTIITLVIIIVAQLSNAQSVCDNIEKTVDEFKNEITFRTPFFDTNHNDINSGFELVKTKKSKTYYLSLDAKGRTSVFDAKGVIIILSNGQKLKFPREEVDVKMNDEGGLDYSAFIILNQTVLATLKKYSIVKWKLYIFDNEQSMETGEENRLMLNCMK